MAWLNRTIRFATLALLLVYSSVYGTKNEINVSTNGSSDYTNCPTSAQGCSLMAAFRAVSIDGKFKNSTTIQINPGMYTLNTSFVFEDMDSLTIIGDNFTSVSIQCPNNNSGVAFIKCRGTTIHGISLMSCGTLRNSSSYNNPLFYSALYVKENTDFNVSKVVIGKSLGIGVTMYDTIGSVVIESVTFENNGPNSLNCHYNDSMEHVNKLDNIAKAGGGLYIEFTYKGNGDQLKNSKYQILKSMFKENIAPYSELVNATFREPGGFKHISFSRGGGLSIYIRGSTANNTFLIDSCVFEENQAIWGGGYYVQFLDSASGNQIKITKTNVTRNNACFGGGAFQVSTISSINQSDSQFIPNRILSTNCDFSKNFAVSGGGGTIFGRTSLGYIDNSYHFSNCTWESNEATTGFALTLKLTDYDKGLFGPNSPFKVKLSDCHIKQNTMKNILKHSSGGLGAVYDFLVPLFLRNVHFIENTHTSLVLDTSSVQVYENVTFTGNTGYKGGAVAMYGEASFHLKKGSRLTFDGNNAAEMGGAIFVETPGPDIIVPIVTNNYLQTHECFFKYEDPMMHPDEWQAEVIFIENTAPHASGYSIYTNSLRDCLYSKTVTTDVLEWKSFHYYHQNSSNSTEKRKFEIVTDAVRIKSKKSDWNVSPAELFSPHVTLLDEKNNSVYGIVHVGIHSANKSGVKLGTPSSLFLVKDKIPFLDLKGVSGTKFSVSFRTVGGQFAEKSLENIELKKCNPGFVQIGKQCVCASVDRFKGVSRCNENNTVVYLEKGYWAGVVEDENGEKLFVTAQCPTGYCNCLKPGDIYSLRADECVYEKGEMCNGNRIGVMCGICKDGYSVQVGNQVCYAGCKNSDLWRLFPLLLGLTILVFLIFRINIDVFTCYLNVWLYFYQVVTLVIGVHEESPLDPFITFIIGLAQVTISGFPSCMWKGMDNLGKLGFSYLLPVYVFIVIFIISLIARRFPNSYFARNSTFRASCTLFVLCYSTLARVSMDILRPSKVGDETVVFYQGTVTYFSSYHSYFAVPAILILLFVVIPFPFILVFTPFFITRVRLVQYANPLFNTFQSCFKDQYRWYAAFYFFSRFVFLFFATLIPYGAVKALFMQISSVIVLTVHVLHWPYLERYNLMNYVDSVCLTTMTVISIVAAQMTNNISPDAKDNMKIFINILAYIPLLYAVWYGFYLLYIWGKRKLNPPEQNLNNLSAVNDNADVGA